MVAEMQRSKGDKRPGGKARMERRRITQMLLFAFLFCADGAGAADEGPRARAGVVRVQQRSSIYVDCRRREHRSGTSQRCACRLRIVPVWKHLKGDVKTLGPIPKLL
jgi:hypothetical protein